MDNPIRNKRIAAATILLVMLIIAPACQGDTQEKIPVTRDGSIVVELAAPDAEYKWKQIREIIVHRGESIQIDVGANTVLFLIPSNRFQPGAGVTDWVVSTTFTAFKVEGGGAVITLDECFPASESEQVIQYSVLARSAEDRSGEWDYVHGANPPPKMIIPAN